MANEEQADAARQQYRNKLMKKRGVHAIGIERGSAHGQSGWVVVAHVEPGKHVKLPSTLAYATEAGSSEVPLVALESEPFKPE